MSYPFNYPTQTNANVQIFGGQAANGSFIWTKPQGVSFVWFTLIGHGGTGVTGDGATVAGGGGGSGAVTNCLMPAFLVPDSLNVRVYNPRSSTGPTQILYRTKGSTTGFALLTAWQGNSGGIGAGGIGGAADPSSYFSSAGLYQSVAGQDGVATATISPSSTTFLSGGAGSNSACTVNGNYGYSSSASTTVPANGYFQFQPIIVGLGGGNASNQNVVAVGGFGCGGSGNTATGTISFGYGGPGLVVIISW